MKSAATMTPVIVAALWSLAAVAQDSAPVDAEPTAGEDTATEGDAATEGEAAEAATAMPLPAAPADPPDVHPPVIEDLAVASGNPDTPPMITAVITDDWSGVEAATIYFRKPGAVDYLPATFAPGSGGVFIARLPEGTQLSGFQYYVEVFDAAKNGPARLGSPLEPFEVGPADIGTLERMERERQREELGPIHPAWMMVSLGTGIIAGAGTAAFLIDIAANVNPNIEAAVAAGDTAAREEWERARLADVTIASVLGVISAAGIVTGVSLLTYAAIAE